MPGWWNCSDEPCPEGRLEKYKQHVLCVLLGLVGHSVQGGRTQYALNFKVGLTHLEFARNRRACAPSTGEL